MFNKMIIVLLLMFIMPVCVFAQEIRAGETLTLKRAISIALSNHPDIKAAIGAVEVSQSRIGQARSDYYPGININSGITRYSSPNSDGSNFSASLNLNQNIYDFGKRESKVDIEQFGLQSTEQDHGYTRIQVIYNVKKTYHATLQAQSFLEVSREVVRQYEEHLSKARGFYEAGIKPKYEVTKAEADLANGRVNLIRANNTLKINLALLKNAIALPNSPDFEPGDEPILNVNIPTLDELYRVSMTSRFDLVSMIAKERAQERRIDLQKAGYYPYITGSAGYGWSGDRMPLDKGWNVGASLTFPLFTGFQTKYLVNEAQASLSVIRSQIEALKQKILLEVNQAYLNAIEARQRIDAAQVSVNYAEQNLELARGRYNVGVGSPIEVTDALSAYSNARNTLISAQYDYNIALADIERASGYLFAK